MTATEATAPANGTGTLTPAEPDRGTSKAEQYIARVQQLRDSGMQQSDAFKKVAEENGVAVSTVRGVVYRSGGTSSTARKKPTDPTEAAAQLFRDAIDRIDSDLEALKERAEEAKREYEHAKANAGDLRKKYEQQIKALGLKVER